MPGSYGTMPTSTHFHSSVQYLIRQKEAQASLLDAQGSRDVLSSGIQTSQTRIAEQDANLAEAQAKLWQAEQDYHRYERLLKDESVPEQQFELAKANYEAAHNYYISDVKLYNQMIDEYDKYNLENGGTFAKVNKAEYKVYKDYIDYDKDGEYFGKEVTANEER